MRPANSIGKVLAVGAALVAGFAVATSIWLNPPSEYRARAMDSLRHRQISQLERAISTQYRLRQSLPANLDELHADGNLAPETGRDPGTGQAFEYEVLGEKNYRLCAIFERDADDERRRLYSRRHKAGRDCFELTAKAAKE